MPITYVTGPSGSGKSTICLELVRLGYKAVDADTELCAWFNNKTGDRVDYPNKQADRSDNWEEKHSFRMSEKLVAELLERFQTTGVFICGNALRNDLEIADKYFEKVICLWIDEDTMIARVSARTNNKYGNDEDQQSIMLKWYKPTIERYRTYGAEMIDATRPVDQVVVDILKAV